MRAATIEIHFSTLFILGAVLRRRYDFGDNWKFDVTLEKILPANPRMTKPKITEKHGKPPKQYNYDDVW